MKGLGVRKGWLRRGILLITSLLWTLHGNAQANWEDEKWETLSQIADYYRIASNSKEGDSLMAVLEQKAIEKKDSVILLKLGFFKVNSHINNEHYVDSVLDELVPFMPHGGMKDSIEYHIDRGFAASLRADYQLQIVHLDTAVHLAEEFGDSTYTYYCMMELSMAYYSVDEVEAALKYSRLAKSYLKGQGNEYMKMYAERNMGVLFLEMPQYDSAHYYLEIAAAGYERLGNLEEATYTRTLNGKTYFDEGEYEKARPLLEKGRDILFEDGGSEYSKEAYGEVWTWLAELYLKTGEHEKAKTSALTAFNIAEEFNLSFERVEALKLLLMTRLADDPGASEYFKDYLAGQEELYNEENQRAVLEYERKYLAEQAEKKVLLLEQKAREAEIQRQNYRFWVFVIIALILLVALVAVVIALRTRIKSQERISELNRRALQLQINPHFFFNVLNSISNYIGRNDQKAAHFYLARFARLMRLSLESSRESWVELGKELDLVEAYLELEKLRKDKFEFEVICPEELRSKKVPPMFVQPFVENAVVHAFEGEIEHPGQITIRAIDELGAGLLKLEIEDNGVGIGAKENVDEEKSGKTSLAISILEERLASYGKKKGSVSFEVPFPEKKASPGTRVILRIPLI